MPEPGARHTAKRLSRLSDLMTCLSRTRFVGDALRVVCSHTKHITGVDRVSIALLRSRGTCELFALDGAEGELPRGSALPTTDTLIGAVVDRGTPVLISDTAGHEWVDVDMLGEMGMGAAMDFPLIASGTVMGTLNTAAITPVVYDEETAAVLNQIASMLAVTLRALQSLDTIPISAAFVRSDPARAPEEESPVDIQACVDAALERARASEFASTISFSSRVEPSVPDAVLDLSALERALDDVTARAIALTRWKALEIVITNDGCDAEHVMVSAVAPDTDVSISVKIRPAFSEHRRAA